VRDNFMNMHFPLTYSSWQWVRHWKLWKRYCAYFPIRLVKTDEMDPKRNYLFGCHPHGILCSGAFGNFATEGNNVSQLFPGIVPHLLTLEGHYLFPFYREYLMCSGNLAKSKIIAPVIIEMTFAILLCRLALLTPNAFWKYEWQKVGEKSGKVFSLLSFLSIMFTGSCSASKNSINYLLSRPEGGHACVVVVGGAPESLDSRPGSYIVQLKKRKGFIKVALRHG